MPNDFHSVYCRVPVGTLSGLQCSGIATWMQALTTKPTSPGCQYILTTEVSMWRYCSNLHQHLTRTCSSWFHFRTTPCQSVSCRSRSKMKALSWHSTASWTFCVSQSSPCIVGGSATSTLMPTSSLTSESWMGSTGLSLWCLTSVKTLPSQISPLSESYQTSWRCWWAQSEPMMAQCCKSLAFRHKQARGW